MALVSIETVRISARQLKEITGWPDKLVDDYLTILDNTIEIVENLNLATGQIEQNTLDIAQNAAAIATNAAAIATNAANIATNTANITTVTNNFNTHNSSSSQHGVTGNNVGTGDFATSGTGGVVLEAVNVADAVLSTVSVTSPDATDLPSVITLANEMKGDLNQLVTDTNNGLTQLNDFLAANQAANQMVP